jgi:cation diffusion facilitator CzcD-associated flavoprotein CzcO
VCTSTLLCTNSSSPRTRDMAAPKLSCVVIGGGVTGLALAHRLLVLGGGRIGVTVLEAQSRTGGWVQSHVQDGVLMEGGARSLRVPGERERVCVCACMCMHRPSHTAVQRGAQGGRRVRADEQWHACTHAGTHARTHAQGSSTASRVARYLAARVTHTRRRACTHTHTHTHTRARAHTHTHTGNGATTLKLISELKLCDQIVAAAPASKVRYIWYKGDDGPPDPRCLPMPPYGPHTG